MSSVLDLVGIQGDDFLPSEMFQGIACSGSSSEDDSSSQTPISEDSDLADGLWQGQNEKIESENDYCDQLQEQFKQKQQKVNNVRDKILDVIQEVIGEIAGDALGGAAAGAATAYTGNPVVGAGVGWFVGLLTELGIEWGLDYLATLLTRGNELLDGIKAENELLLTIEKSRENYEYRELVLARHREDIRLVLEQIRAVEQSLNTSEGVTLEKIAQAIKDLKYNDEMIDLGGVRIWHKNKVIEYG